MLLAINAENTTITIGCFAGRQLRLVTHIATQPQCTAEQFACQIRDVLSLHGVAAGDIRHAVLGSVVPPLNYTLFVAVKLLCGCDAVCISSGVKTGLNIKMDQPRSVGSDLVCLAAEAREKGKVPCLVVDVSTCITFTALDRAGALVGSAIAPGVRMGLTGLRMEAAQLPGISLSGAHAGLIGKNTVDSMASGVRYGGASMVDGMIARFREQLGALLTVYLTGTDAELIASLLREPVERYPDMVLHGLQRIWERNIARK